MDAATEQKIEKDYIESLKEHYNEVSEIIGFEDIEHHEMIKYLLVLEVLLLDYEDGKLSLAVICNDLFVWGCADAEPVTWEELPELFRMCLEDSKFGSSKWCCRKVNFKPQEPFIKLMKKHNAWESWMDDLKDTIKV